MTKSKKKRSGKAPKPAKSHPPRPSETGELKKEDDNEDFGGMNLSNFRKNLGCG